MLAEFSKIAQATSVGFFIMGFIGFFVKLIFIPINNVRLACCSSGSNIEPFLRFYLHSGSSFESWL